MSDKPLFQNADDQEAAYGGEATPATPEGVVIPGAAAYGGGISGNIGTAGAMGAVPAAGPEIAGATRDTQEDMDDDGVIEDREGSNPR